MQLLRARAEQRDSICIAFVLVLANTKNERSKGAHLSSLPERIQQIGDGDHINRRRSNGTCRRKRETKGARSSGRIIQHAPDLKHYTQVVESIKLGAVEVRGIIGKPLSTVAYRSFVI